MRIRKKYIVGVLILIVFTSIACVGCGDEEINVEDTIIYSTLQGEPETRYISYDKMEEPYVIINRDFQNNYDDELEREDWVILGCSNGAISKKNISEVKTVVACRGFYKYATYEYENASEDADSEYISIYCYDVKTKGQYLSKDKNEEIDCIAAKPFPKTTTETPHYRYSDEEIVNYVNENFDKWRN